MMQCYHCGSRSFGIGRTQHSTVWIRCDTHGDYEEKSEDVTDSTWHWLRCTECDEQLDEEKARDCFDTSEED